jgi:hypothetical protein
VQATSVVEDNAADPTPVIVTTVAVAAGFAALIVMWQTGGVSRVVRVVRVALRR